MAFAIPVAIAAVASSVAGAGLGAYGAYQQGQAEKNAANYNAAVAGENANVAKQNVQIAGQSGAAQAGIASEKSRATVGAIQANQAAANIDINSGSAVEVRSSARELGELDALSVRSNAVRQAYGYEVQGQSQEAEAGLQKLEAETAQQAGDIGAASTLLGGTGSAASNFARYQLAGGFGGS